jgi:hypothetical protein
MASRGFRLNGWQRIGILLSMIWFVSFAGFIWTSNNRHAADFYGGQLRLCQAILDSYNFSLQYIQDPDKRNKASEENWTKYEKCQRDAEEFYHRDVGDRSSWGDWGRGLLLLFGIDLATIVFAWLLAWFGVVTVRWIRRGFQAES